MVLTALQTSVLHVLQSELLQSSFNNHVERTDKSRGTTRYSFAHNLFDIAFHRGGKRQRSNSASSTEQGVSNHDRNCKNDGGLSDIPEAVLADSIQPIIGQLQELDAEELLSLTRVDSGGAILREGIQVRPIHSEITPLPDEENDEESSSSCSTVRYIHLQEVPDQYTMGVFVFPPHAKIPLHDHPGMCVISRILYGDIHRRSLDLPNPPDNNHSLAGQEKRRRAYYRTPRKANPALPYERKGSSNSSDETDSTAIAALPNDSILKIPVETFTAPQCTVLYPHQGNLHEFVAGPNGAAVLDVLLPPYSTDHHRDCTFYDVVECDHSGDDMNHGGTGADIDVAATIKDESRKDYVSHLCWIVPTERPEDFHCLSGQYRLLGR